MSNLSSKTDTSRKYKKCHPLKRKKDAHRVFLLLVLFGTRLPVADKVVQCAVLYKCGEDEDEADGHKQVHGGHIGNFWKGFPGNSTQRGHGQHSGDAW